MHARKRRHLRPAPALFEPLEDRILFSAQPVATIDAPQTVTVGGTFTATVTFDNVPDATPGSDVGYAPILDVVLPTRGADGSAPGEDPPSPPDGVTFLSASYLGRPVGATTVAFAADGTALHPILTDGAGQPLVVNAADFGARPGDTLVVLRLPFGSFAPDQPAAAVALSLSLSPLADPDTPLTIASRGAFAFGLDPLNNPSADPPVVGGIVSDSFTPTVLAFRKSFDGPEGETATGPNFPRTYRIAVDLADGQTLTDLRIVDRLPDGIVLPAGAGSISVAGLPGATVVFDPATNDLTVTAPGPLVGAAGPDGVITVRFFVGETLAPGDPATPVLGPGADSPRTIRNDLFAEAEWTPLDPRDPPQTITFDPPGAENSFVARPLAVQKSVVLAVDRGAPGTGPGDTLEWRISGQVSDHVSLAGLTLADRLSDGQAFDPSFAPRLVVNQAGTSTAIPLDPADYVAMRNPADGTTDLSFRVGDRIGVLVGGETAGAATTFTLAYRSTIEARFASPAAPGDAVVGQGDSLSNRIGAAATSTDPGGVPVGGTVTDDSAAALGIATGRVGKEIWRINGVAPTAPNPTIVSGDLVTFRLTYTLPQSSFSSLVLADFLPLPVFDIGSVSFTFDDTVSADAPAENVITWGPDAGAFDALLGARDPVFAVDAGSNVLRVRFDEPLRSDPSVASTVDLLFTLRVADRPFGDGLFLTNLVQGTETNAAGRATSSQDLVGVRLSEPDLRISKGIIAFAGSPGILSAPPGPDGVTFSPPGSAGPRFTGTISSDRLAARGIDADLANMDAGDLVTFAIVIENTGSGRDGAFDVELTDTLPQGFVVPATGLDYRVTDGAGTPIPFVGVTVGPSGFIERLVLADRPGAGAIAPFDPTSGRNVVVVTYDLQVFDTVQPGSTITNLAALENYAAFEGGSNRTINDPIEELEDTASVAIGFPTLDKIVVATSLPQTGLGQGNPALWDLAIGEQVTFDIVLTLREGDYRSLVLTDQLPLTPGRLDLVSASLVSIGANLRERDPVTLAVGGPISPSLTTLDSNGDGRPDRVAIDFGPRIVNLFDNVVDEKDQVVLRVVAVASNDPGTGAGDTLRNVAEASFLAPAAPATITAAASVEIVEPNLAISKTGSPATIEAGQPISYTITVRNTGGSFLAPAFDLRLTDLFEEPALFLRPGTVSVTGVAGAEVLEGNGAGDARLIVGVPVLPVGAALTIRFIGEADVSALSGDRIDNTVRGVWSSLPGTDPGERAHAGEASASLLVKRPGIVKSVVATDLAETSGTSVAIGETITYRLTVTLAEATTQVLLRDFLPVAGTGSIGYVAGSFRVASVGANLVPADGQDLLNPTLTVTNRNDADGLGLADTLAIDFGRVINVPDGMVSDRDRIVVEFQGRVANAANTQPGRALPNRAEIDFGFGRLSSTATVIPVSPALGLDKIADAVTGDAGDVLTFRIDVPHLAGADRGPAYDVVVTDPLNPFYELITGSVRLVSGPAGTTIETGNAAGDGMVRIEAPSYALNDPRLVFEYQARVRTTVEPTQVLVNTARVTYDSFPGPAGPTWDRPGTPAADEHRFTVIGPALSKRVIATDIPETRFEQFNPLIQDVALGETITYLVGVTLPEGTTTNARLNDVLPTPFTLGPRSEGVVEYLDSRIIGVGGNLSGPSLPPVGTSLPAFDFDGDGLVDLIELPVGTVVNAPDGVVSDADRIFFEVRARVIDLPINQAGLAIVNRANLFYEAQGEQRSATVTETVEIVAPRLAIAKSVSPGTADAGDRLLYELVIDHVFGASRPTDNSTQAAFDVVVEDLLPDDVGLLWGTVTVASTGPIAPVIEAGNGAGDETVRVRVPTFPLDAGPIVIRFEATANDSVRPEQEVTNRSDIDYRSAPPALPGRPFEGAATASFTVRTPAFDKAIVGTSLPETGSGQFDPARPDVTVGEEVTYHLTARLIEGTQRVTIVDTLPAGLEVVSARVFAIGDGISGTALGVGDAGALAGNTVIFDFGGNVVNRGDNDPANDTIVAEVVARVRDVPSNQPGTVLTNAAALDYGPRLTPTVGRGVDVVQPSLTVQKSGPTGVLDAGDRVTYTVRIGHAADSTAAAFDLDLRDLLPATLVYVPGSVALSGVPGTVLPPTAPTDPVRVVIPVLPIGQTATITYRADIGIGVTPGLQVRNVADLDYDTARGPFGRPLEAADDHVVRIRTPAISKSVVATSVPETTSGAVQAGVVDLTIGETVTFRLTATLPEGTTPNLVIEDWLPATTSTTNRAGVLEYVSSRIVSYGSGISGASLPPVGSAGAAFDRPGVGPPGILDAVRWSLGTVVNAPNNDPPASESNRIVFEVTARLIDAPQNAANDLMTNQARLTYRGGADGTATITTTGSAQTATVEPRLATVVKAGTPLVGDAGTEITYTVTVGHAVPFPGQGPAFDVALTDLLAPGLVLVPGSVTTNLGSVTVGNGAGDSTIRIDVPVYRPTDPVLTVSYRARLADSVTHDGEITNTARVTYDSAPGDAPGQRTYAPIADSATVRVRLEPGFAKGVVATSVAETGSGAFRPGAVDLAVGETVTFGLVATLGEGTQPLVMRDLLPEGFEIVRAWVERIGANVSGSALAPGAEVAPVGQAVVFDFGMVTNAGDNVIDARDQVEVRIAARVRDVAGIAAGSALDNAAEAAFGPSGTLRDAARADVVEPALRDPVKSVVNLTRPGAPADAGSVLGFTVTLARDPAATAPAFDVVLRDALPASLALDPLSVSASFGAVAVIGNEVVLSVPVWGLADPETITLSYRARVADLVRDGEAITNTVRGGYTSLPGESGFERVYTVAPASSETLVSVIPDLAKTVLAPADRQVAVGEVVTYRLIATLGEGTQRVVVEDLLPAGLEAVAAEVVAVGGNISGALLGPGAAGEIAPDGRAVLFDLGPAVTNAGDNLVDERDRVVFEVRARLLDLAAIQPGVTLANAATLTWDSGTTPPATDTVTVVGPDLVVAKTVDRTVVDAGERVRFTVTVRQAPGATAAAYDLVLTDSLPAGYLLDAGSVVASAGTVAAAGDTVTLSLDAFALEAAPLTLSYQAIVADSVRDGEVITNTVRLVWDSAAGPGGRVGSAEDRASVLVDFLPALAKTVWSTSLAETAGTDLAIGEVVTYRLTVTPGQGTQRLALSDLLPDGLGVEAVRLVETGANVTLSGPPAITILGQRVEVAFGDVTVRGREGSVPDAEDRIVVEIDARVRDVAGNLGLPAPGTALTNAALLAYDGDGDPAPAAVTVSLVEPRVASLAKSGAPRTGDAGDVITFTLAAALDPLSTGPAYAVTLTDALPAGYELIPGSAATSLGTAATVGNTLTVTIPVWQLGDGPLAVTYQARLADTVGHGDTLTNTVRLDYASAPEGTPEARPYAPLSASDTISVALTPGFAKALAATSIPETPGSSVTIGEVVTYRLTATLADGTQTVRVTDLLPEGLRPLTAVVETIGSDLSGGLLGPGDAGTILGGLVSFDFGTVTNAGQPGSVPTDADRITLLVTALVEDLPGTIAGTVLQNAASLATDGRVVPADPVPVGVVEPRLAVTKTADRVTGDAGTVITYTLTVAHRADSTAPAFDLVVTDALDPRLVLVPGSVTTTAGTPVAAGGAIRVELDRLLASDPVLTITFQARLADSVRIGEVVPNTAVLAYDSAPGPGGRADQGTASAAVTAVFAPTLAKSVAATSNPGTGSGQFDPTIPDVAPGEVVTFRLIATLGEGTQQVVVVDDLPVEGGLLEFVAARVVSVGGNISGALPGAPAGLDTNADGRIDRVVFDFGPDVTNAGDNVVNDLDRIVLEVDLRATLRAAALPGSVLANRAVIDFGVGVTPPASAAVETVARGGGVPPVVSLFDRAGGGAERDAFGLAAFAPRQAILTGTADVGTEILLTLRDGSGRTVGLVSTLADPGGNWAASIQPTRAYIAEDRGTDAWRAASRLFGRSDAILPDVAYRPFLDDTAAPFDVVAVALRGTAPPFAGLSGAEWTANLRATYGSGLGPDPTFGPDLTDTARAFAEASAFRRAEAALEDAQSLIALGWNKFSGEYLPRGPFIGA